jgi:hypothetical protein
LKKKLVFDRIKMGFNKIEKSENLLFNTIFIYIINWQESCFGMVKIIIKGGYFMKFALYRKNKSNRSFLLMILLAAALIFQTAMAVPADRSDVANAQPNARSTSMSYKTNYTYVYNWNVDLTSRATAQSIGSSSSSVKENKTNLAVTFRITPVQFFSATAEYKIVMVISNAVFTHKDQYGNTVTDSDPDLLNQLKVPAVFYQKTNGSISQFFAKSTDSLESLNIKRGIISALQTSLPTDYYQRAISSNPETSVNGDYTPEYSSAPSGSYLIITKTATSSNYSAFAGAERSGRALSDVNFTEKAITKYNCTTGVIDSVNTDSTYNAASPQDTSAANTGTTNYSDAFGKGTLTLSTNYQNTASFDLTNLISKSLMADAFEPEEEPDFELPDDKIKPDYLTPERDSRQSNSYSADQLHYALRSNALKPHQYPRVIEALSGWKNPQAQEMLILIAANEKLHAKYRGQAVIALGFSQKPSENTMTFLEAVCQNNRHPLNQQAYLMLGAACERFATINPSRTRTILRSLEMQLFSSRDENVSELLISALGNSASGEVLDSLGSYLLHPTGSTRYCTVLALKKINHPQAIEYLRQAAESDENSFIRETAQRYIMPDDGEGGGGGGGGSTGGDTGGTSGGTTNTSTTNSKTWSKSYKIGNGNVYGKIIFDAQFTAKPNNTTSSENFYVYGGVEAKAYAWSWNYSLAKGYGFSEVVNVSGVLKRKFKIVGEVLGKTVYQLEKYLTCGNTFTGSLFNQSLQFFDLSYNFYPYGIKVSLGVKASGNVNATYKYGFNACNVPITANAFVTITPGASVTATGEASVSIYIAKAGVSLIVDLFKTTLPTTLNAIAQTVSPYIKLNLKSILSMQPVSGKLKLWAKVRKIMGGWRTVLDVTLWSFSGSTYNWTLIDEWWNF